MRVGVVDIGTNSMRMLICDETNELARRVEVTGLGKGVDSTGRLAPDAIERTVAVLEGYGAEMDTAGVERRYAIATSASRDAANREEFFDLAEGALGVRPELISGQKEGTLAFRGATAEFPVSGAVVVTDIGGGSTELVTSGSVTSIDMGSVRLNDRLSPRRPLSDAERSEASQLVASVFSDIDVGQVDTHIGVAGTWTALAAIALELPEYDRSRVHGHSMSVDELERLVDLLAGMTLEETARIPSLDPKRAPVIFAGALVARALTELIATDEVVISERDTLDGAAMELLRLP